MSVADQSYFEQRAKDELQLAEQASHPAVVKTHYEMAAQYLARLDSGMGKSETAPKLPNVR